MLHNNEEGMVRGTGVVRTVDPSAAQGRQHEQAARLAGVAVTAAACVPARMVQLIPLVGHRQPVDDLRPATPLHAA